MKAENGEGGGGREHTSMRLQCCRLHPLLHFLSVGNKTDRHISSAAINGRSLWTVEDLSIQQGTLNGNQHPIKMARLVYLAWVL